MAVREGTRDWLASTRHHDVDHAGQELHPGHRKRICTDPGDDGSASFLHQALSLDLTHLEEEPRARIPAQEHMRALALLRQDIVKADVEELIVLC